MDLLELLTVVQGHYVQQLSGFVDEQKAKGQGGAEINFQLQPGSGLFRDLHCADFAFGPKAPGGPRIVDLYPDRMLSMPPSTFKHSGVTVQVQSLRWDNIQIVYSGRKPDLGAWFETWFDPEDKRNDPKAKLGNKIHSLSMTERAIYVDFGSAAPKAFLDMTDAFAAAGITKIEVSIGEETPAKQI